MVTMSAAYMREYRAKRAVERDGDFLLPYQRQFLAAVTRRDNRPELAAVSVGRGNGKTYLCGEMLARALKPSDDPLYVEGAESVLVSASRPMAELTLEAARLSLGDDPEFRWRRDGVEHMKTRTRCRVLSSDSRRAFGLGSALNLAVLDEPGSFAPTSGERLWRALLGSLGKNSSARILACGTIAPAAVGSWWQTFIEAGSGPGKHVQLIQGNEKTWRSWDAVLAANPVCAISKSMVRTLKREHDEALQNDRAASAFLRYRMNINAPEVTHAQPLVTSSEWSRVCARPVPACEGQPIIGADLGGTRSWSAAAAIWPSGRISSWAVAPGLPSLSEQEAADQVAPNTYVSLVRSGGLSVDEGRAVPDVEQLLARIWSWSPLCIVSDPYRSAELAQAVGGRVRLIERSRSGGEATSNIQALRSMLLDTASGVTESSRDLLGAAFQQTNLVIDNSGLTKVVKLDQRRSRDDSAMALLLAAGEKARRPAPVELRGAVISRSGEVTWL